MRDAPSGTGFPRRGILRALALAPLTACAGPAAGRAAPAADPAAPKPSPGPAPSPPAPGAVAAIRAFQLAADAEPAFSFRAVTARPGEPR